MSKGYTFVSDDYISNQDLLSIKCERDHIFQMRFNNFQQGQRCPVCNAIDQKSTQEREVLEYVRSIYTGVIVENDRTIIRSYSSGLPLELDIWLPEIRLAIEFNGVYWHTKEQHIHNDRIKLAECERKGLTLLVITDVEWIEDHQIVLDRIFNLLL